MLFAIYKHLFGIFAYLHIWQKIAIFIYYENINKCVKLQKLQKFTTKNLLGKGGGLYMNEIVLTHNGISYTKEDIIEMLDLVMEIVGEQV